MLSQPDISKNEKEGRVAKYLVILVENMHNRIIDKKESEDKKDYPPFFFINYLSVFHKLSVCFSVSFFRLIKISKVIGSFNLTGHNIIKSLVKIFKGGKLMQKSQAHNSHRPITQI